MFTASGWVHRAADSDCPLLVVAWPPPGSDDEDTADADADAA